MRGEGDVKETPEEGCSLLQRTGMFLQRSPRIRRSERNLLLNCWALLNVCGTTKCQAGVQCLADNQGSTLGFPEDGDDACHCIEQERSGVPSRLKASSETADLCLEAAALSVPAGPCMGDFLCLQ